MLMLRTSLSPAADISAAKIGLTAFTSGGLPLFERDQDGVTETRQP